MTVHWPRTSATARTTRTAVLVYALLWCMLPGTTSAHAGDGIDAGFAHIIASASVDGTTTVEVRITETDDCAKFWTGWLTAQRDTVTINGDLTEHDRCVFVGSVVLPERGRWVVTVRLVYATRPTEIQIPVGFSGEPGTFERTDWLHVDTVPEPKIVQRAWYMPSGAIAYAVIGLLIGTAIEFGRRRLVEGRSVTPG